MSEQNAESVRRCSTCGGRLQFVAVEENRDTTYVCVKCGDEWFGSTIDTEIDLGL